VVAEILYLKCAALLRADYQQKNTYYRMSLVADINISQGSVMTTKVMISGDGVAEGC